MSDHKIAEESLSSPDPVAKATLPVLASNRECLNRIDEKLDSTSGKLDTIIEKLKLVEALTAKKPRTVKRRDQSPKGKTVKKGTSAAKPKAKAKTAKPKAAKAKAVRKPKKEKKSEEPQKEGDGEKVASE
jgi:hypothetical protein